MLTNIVAGIEVLFERVRNVKIKKNINKKMENLEVCEPTQAELEAKQREEAIQRIRNFEVINLNRIYLFYQLSWKLRDFSRILIIGLLLGFFF
uniref:Uncharacterized protein n=1 Tax=Heterorhabditis bacteriophora TaxID=37862 RepID=A0A1I7WA21_HETBA